MKITVAGLGPRGLSVCLYALARGLEVTAYDPNPLGTWAPPQILPQFTLRSPSTFDLVTNGPDSLQVYSLRTYLGYPSPTGLTQEQLETDEYRPSRIQMSAYLNWVWNQIRDSIDWIPTTCPSPPTVMAIGSGIPKIPVWAQNTRLLNQITNNPNHTGRRLLVIGSGQQAAEWVVQLAVNNQVSWVHNPARSSLYPVPSYTDWGEKTALGSHYSSNLNTMQQAFYLAAVKQWQPSITPEVLAQLDTADYEDISSQQALNINWDAVVLATGRQTTQHELHNFRASNGVYYTGTSAINYDGPRQGSLISAGPTAHSIINSFIL